MNSLAYEESIVIKLNNVFLDCVRNTKSTPPVVARAASILHTCIYDAWAAYDETAIGTELGATLRRPLKEHTNENKELAISYAAYNALIDLFPSEKEMIDEMMEDFSVDPENMSTDTATPIGIGNVACNAVLEFRHSDGSNQLGDLHEGSYSDYTGYAPTNSSDEITDPNSWQPLKLADGMTQSFLLPQWGMVTPFALKSGEELRPKAPPFFPDKRYISEAKQVVRFSTNLDDRKKMIVEYWADGPSTETPPGHWNLLAHKVSRDHNNSLDDDVKLYFALGNALLDASIAVWESKVFYDYIRPVSAIHFLFGDKNIKAWGGSGKGTQTIMGSEFQSYIQTPPFSEYVSGHSTFSSASATILELFTGNDKFDALVILNPGSSMIEPGITPAKQVMLNWKTFRQAADEAGISRRYGGIHFLSGDLNARKLGKQIGVRVWEKANQYFEGNI